MVLIKMQNIPPSSKITISALNSDFATEEVTLYIIDTTIKSPYNENLRTCLHSPSDETVPHNKESPCSTHSIVMMEKITILIEPLEFNEGGTNYWWDNKSRVYQVGADVIQAQVETYMKQWWEL